MKKIILFLLMIIFSNATCAVTELSNKDKIKVASDLKLIAITQHEENKALKYSIDTKYPQLAGRLNSAAKEFNKQIKKLVAEKVAEFKKTIYESATAIQELPTEVKQNSFEFDYDANAIKMHDHIIVGLRLHTENYFAGAAHPSHDVFVYNFDLSTGKPLQLANFFQADSDYLKIISDYARLALSKKVKNDDKDWFEKGTQPTAQNYANWNLQSKGLLFTFDDYQVAAYVYGQPEVLVPYSELKTVIGPDSLLAN